MSANLNKFKAILLDSFSSIKPIWISASTTS